MKKLFTKFISILFLTIFVFSQVLFVNAATRSSLEQQAIEIQAKINDLEKNIDKKNKNINNLDDQKQVLEDEISQAKLEIQASDLAVQQTGLDIAETEENIGELEKQMARQKILLAEQIRAIYYLNNQSLIKKLLAQENLSSMLNTLEAINKMQEQTRKVLLSFRETKVNFEKEQEELKDREAEQVMIIKFQEAQKMSLDRQHYRKKKLLSQAQSEKVLLQKLQDQNHASLSLVRERIRLLQSGGETLSFEQALKYAEYGAKLTGVRSAFLLAILRQESDMGANVGSCFYDKALRGKSAEKRKQAFEQITKELGKNPATTLVSCPAIYKGKYIGSGGAMGPAQFMPDTWLGYKNEVARLTGHNPPSPWSIEDAIVAMALKLKKGGASIQTRAAERKAAGAYFGKCKFGHIDYCDDVLALADLYQGEIDGGK